MRDITYAEALSEISHAVDFYISQLEKGDAVEIPVSVTLKAEGLDDGHFEPSEGKNFSREEYGLVSSVPSAESGDGQTRETRTYFRSDVPDAFAGRSMLK